MYFILTGVTSAMYFILADVECAETTDVGYSMVWPWQYQPVVYDNIKQQNHIKTICNNKAREKNIITKILKLIA